VAGQGGYDSVKEQIRESIDIVELISRYVPLHRQGQNYVGRCPWHDDSRPSLQVNSQRQTWKCWVCNIGGDVFSFVMQMEKVGFREAMEMLAERAGVTIPKQNTFVRLPKNVSDDYGGYSDYDNYGLETEPVTEPEQSQLVSKRVLFSAMNWAAGLYHKALLELDEAGQARKYLRERGITDVSIKQFNLGYAPIQRDWWLQKLKGDCGKLNILEVIGILARSQRDETPQSNAGSSQYYDRFRGRVLFPIRDTQDRTVAFGGRVLPNMPNAGKTGKYVNSPETPLFSKHRMLYGLDIARLTMGKSRRVLIMEGYTDCIMAHQHGFTDAVAILGTALGAEHIRVLKRYADRMLLVLDGDKAGRKRTDEVLGLFVAQGVDMAVLTLPGNEDPCEFLEHYGADALENLIANETTDALEHAFQSATAGVDLKNDIIAGNNALDKLLNVIALNPAKIGDANSGEFLRIEKMMRRLADKFAVDESYIRRRLKQLRENAERKSYRQYDGSEIGGEVEQNETDISGEASMWNDRQMLPDNLERELLELLITEPASICKFWETNVSEKVCRSPVTRTIYQRADKLMSDGIVPTLERLLIAFDDPQMKNFLVDLDDSCRKKRTIISGEQTKEKGVVPKQSEEIPYDDETVVMLVEQIADGFERRDYKRRETNSKNKLRGEGLTRDERLKVLADYIGEQRKRQKIEDTDFDGSE
jgi:DNA primase